MVSSRRREETRRVFGRRRDDDVGGGKHVSVCVCVWLFRRLLLKLSLLALGKQKKNLSLLFLIP